MAGGVSVGVVAGPGVEGGVLESAGEAEGDGPREGVILDDGSEVVGGLFDGLTAREEDDAGEVGRNMVFECVGCVFADFFWGGLGFVAFTGEYHVDFKNAGA